MTSRPIIVIFQSGHRPIENLKGLLHQAHNEPNFKYVLINSLFSRKQVLRLYFDQSPEYSFLYFVDNIITIYQACFVFGKLNWAHRILLKIFGWRGFLISIPPGKITKGVGFFKNNLLSFGKIVNNALTTNVFSLRILSTDIFDALYLSSAHAYPINHIVLTRLPKHIYINHLLSSSTAQQSILFAPTERDYGHPSPILQLLSNVSFVDQLLLSGLKIFYSQHPHDKNSLSLDPRITSFKPCNCSSTCLVVTDYSSIGADFLASGGKSVIYYIPDVIEFKKLHGLGPFMSHEFNKGHSIYSKDELLLTIFELIANDKLTIDSLNCSETPFFYNLYNRLYLGKLPD